MRILDLDLLKYLESIPQEDLQRFTNNTKGDWELQGYITNDNDYNATGYFTSKNLKEISSKINNDKQNQTNKKQTDERE